jgi:hypothetical protein
LKKEAVTALLTFMFESSAEEPLSIIFFQLIVLFYKD